MVMNIKLPKLEPSGRDREFKKENPYNISKVVCNWLFSNSYNHRKLDRQILGYNSEYSKGFFSMGVLHFLGLKKEFKGVFVGLEKKDAIILMLNDNQSFDQIIQIIEYSETELNIELLDKLRTKVLSENIDLNDKYKMTLKNLEHTDKFLNSSPGRIEQAYLRAYLYGGLEEKECAFCKKKIPVQLMVAAHIKPRKNCSHDERVDLNIVIPACKLGCDELYEQGYILVNKQGFIKKNKKKKNNVEFDKLMDKYDGQKCTHFNSNTKKYFMEKLELIVNVDNN